eukprot:2521026-Prymnesium_polylepis.2
MGGTRNAQHDSVDRQRRNDVDPEPAAKLDEEHVEDEDAVKETIEQLVAVDCVGPAVGACSQSCGQRTESEFVAKTSRAHLASWNTSRTGVERQV